MADNETKETAGFEVHSEARGPHWVAWLTRGSETRPVRDVLLVGENQDEAESRAREWIRRAQSTGYV